MKTSLSLLQFKEDFDIIARFDGVALVFVPEPNTLILIRLGRHGIAQTSPATKEDFKDLAVISFKPLL